MRKKEQLTEDMEIQKELGEDDITPIQGRVDKLFDDVEIATAEEDDSDYVITDVEELGGAGNDNIIVTVEKGGDSWSGTLEYLGEK